MPSLFCFGDSWGTPSELKRGELPFPSILSKKFNLELHNYSKPNMPLGLITRRIVLTLGEIQKSDLVLVVIPPDSRWYTEWKTLDYSDKRNPFYLDKTDDWFRYHHQLFIFTICKLLDTVGCTYLLMHNYGEFPLHDDEYNFPKCYAEKFLSTSSLTSLLVNASDDGLSPIKVEHMHLFYEKIFYGPYFEGTESHPNQSGHFRIAELIENKLGL